MVLVSGGFRQYGHSELDGVPPRSFGERGWHTPSAKARTLFIAGQRANPEGLAYLEARANAGLPDDRNKNNDKGKYGDSGFARMTSKSKCGCGGSLVRLGGALLRLRMTADFVGGLAKGRLEWGL
jgi:hypothetical protein